MHESLDVERSSSLNKDMSPLICIHKLSALHPGQELGSRMLFDWA